ncbi:NAD(P)-binding protein [Exidia glandulosa HHB12029]|uniref:NAD(P)-binding protein n=1 Tax=Exidia glandulosa HHB12029 TaxID=1314781 RepID=A0A165L0S7_EXIGL|nr:NAD(P)-binding protein [Exidia glandulosa HHB12029]
MPAVPAPAKVLVTGASGFLAAHVVKAFLSRGYTVLGTVRSPSKGDYLKRLYEPEFPGKFDYVVVKDIAEPGAFDEAVKDVDAVAHTASPVTFSGDTPAEEVIGPAVAGTVEILKSIRAHGPRVQRIVVTSSFAALLQPHDGPYEYSDKDWNDFSVNEARTNPAASGVHKYRASKVLAERALWDYIANEKPPFDAITVNPPFIYGPLIHEINSLDQLNLSSQLIWDRFAKELPESELATYTGNAIDVRDVADVHVDAIQKPELAGRRLVIGVGAVANQDFYDAAHEAGDLPNLPFPIPRGKPGAADAARPSFVQISPDSARLLGREGKFIGLPQMVKETLQSIVDRGLVTV